MTQVKQSSPALASNKAIPTHRLLPVGSFLIDNLKDIQKKYPDLVHLRLGVAEFYLVTNPDLIQEVLVTKQRNFIKAEFLRRTKKVFGDGLLTSEGDFHHRQRRLVQPAFHHDRLNSYARVMSTFAQRTMSDWTDGKVLDIYVEMTKLTMAIVAKCLFDADLEEKARGITEDLTLTIEYFDRLSSPLAKFLEKLTTNRKYENALHRIDRMVYNLIEERRKSGKDTGDLMSMLLDAKDKDGKRMTDSQLRDEVLILFVAGARAPLTTAYALTWTFYLLSEHPQVQSKLFAEVDALMKPDGLTAADFPKLEYTLKVLTEAMRLYPPAWILMREALRDTRLGEYVIPAGANVLMSQFVNHQDPRYFGNPRSFQPERWIAAFKKSLPKFAYFPFGGGPRSCVGEPFAWIEGALLLATISSKWKLHRVSDHKAEMLPRITLRPKYGMKMRLEQR